MIHSDEEHLEKMDNLTDMRPGIPQLFGMLLVLLSFPAMIIGFPFAYAVTALAWGSIIVSLDQFYKYQLKKKRLDLMKAKLELLHSSSEHKSLTPEEQLEEDRLLATEMGGIPKDPDASIQSRKRIR